MKFIIHFLNILEQHSRVALNRYPVLYTFVASIAGIVFLRGIWKIVDSFFGIIPTLGAAVEGGISGIAGIIVVALAGLLISFFIIDHAGEDSLGAQKHVEHSHSGTLSSKVDLLEAHVGYLDEKLAEMSKKLHNQ